MQIRSVAISILQEVQPTYFKTPVIISRLVLPVSFSGGREIYFASYVPCMYVFVCVGLTKAYKYRNMLPYWFILEDTTLYHGTLQNATTGTREKY